MILVEFGVEVCSALIPKEGSAPSPASPGHQAPGPFTMTSPGGHPRAEVELETESNSKVCPEERSSWKPLLLQLNEEIILLKVVSGDHTQRWHDFYRSNSIMQREKTLSEQQHPRGPPDPHMGWCFVTWAARLPIQAEPEEPGEKKKSHWDWAPVNLLRQEGKMGGSGCWYPQDKRAVMSKCSQFFGRVLKMVRTLISAI